jgi:hypothetical protein
VENFAGAVGNWHEGVFFTEGTLTGSILSKGRLHVEISRQNSNLFEVKNELARQATARGANAIQRFEYGQRAHNWWDLIFSFKWDTESWHGSGEAVLTHQARVG